MQIIIERGALLKALTHVQGVVERRNTIPILANVLLEASDGSVSLKATDLDIEVQETVPADVPQSGGTTVPAHTLYEIVRKLPDGSQVELLYDAGEGRITLSAGRSRFALSCLPVDDFPVIPSENMPHSFVLPAESVRRLIDKTRFAISTEETRYYLNGIYVHATEGDIGAVLRGVATDGHRLARLDVALPEGAHGMPGIIIPRKTVGEIRKLIDELDGDMKISLSDNRILFAFGDVILTSKLIDGTFPDYGRVIPQGNDKTLEVDAKLLRDSVDRVSTISSEKSRAVKLNLEDGKLTLSVNSPDNGSATEELMVTYAGENLEIGFNARYLNDITTQISGTNAVFKLGDSSSPTVVQDLDDAAALYVLMPMRV